MREAQHGTYYYYKRYGCPCEDCRTANREYKRERRMWGNPPSHGRSGYENYGCRCEVCCAAKADAEPYRGNARPRIAAP